jgi:hypothetical protein
LERGRHTGALVEELTEPLLALLADRDVPQHQELAGGRAHGVRKDLASDLEVAWADRQLNAELGLGHGRRASPAPRGWRTDRQKLADVPADELCP